MKILKLLHIAAIEKSLANPNPLLKIVSEDHQPQAAVLTKLLDYRERTRLRSELEKLRT